ncbi:MAG: prepilin-type N-terminal cleavage/methylation domain-containing protein, partial [Candidatus Calescibacterium sp.]|nr:prepilin-type N-terminal cleavage/methylation domain-containing protein [Candidatus Calescibacterium sp.]
MRKKAFTLMEILIAVTIFLLILVWVIDIIRNINMERKMALEKSKINENFILLEKNLKNIVNSSELYIPFELSNIVQGRFDIMKPYYLPSSVIFPSIYDVVPTDRLIVYRNVPPNPEAGGQPHLIVVSSQNNQIIFQIMRRTNNNSSLLNVPFLVNNNANPTIFMCYFEVNSGNLTQVSDLQIINFGNPIINPNYNYQINLRFSRNRITNSQGQIYQAFQDIIHQTTGNVRSVDQLSFRVTPISATSTRVLALYDPSSINVEITVRVFDA